MAKRLSVADFYCGAGGFSEGFRQMGFEVVFALDNWDVARETHKLNHPTSKHPGLDCYIETKGDILLINKERINEIVDDVDVIVGSPPCVSFSMANKAGKADKSLGVKLIKKFLQIVAVKKHMPNSKLKYWLMENVPNSRKFIKEEYTFRMLGLNNQDLKKLDIRKKENDIALKINLSPELTIHNSVFYGVPQRRERLVCGEFPVPNKSTLSESEWMSLGDVINALYNKESQYINDPLYSFSIPTFSITDHFYNTIIPQFEWEEAMMKKQQARYYGRMSFPEDFSKPSRTVLATRSVLARESMILPNGVPGKFRSPTVREVASLMSFPITYLFQGKDESSKYRLVGNAVCPKMIAAFAKAILVKEGLKVPNKPSICKPNKLNLKVDLRVTNPPLKRARDKYPLADFVEIVPDLKFRNFRVELDNNFPKSKGQKIHWNASIHHATGKDEMKHSNPSMNILLQLIFTYPDKDMLSNFIKNSKAALVNIIPSAKIFQVQYTNVYHNESYLTPRKTLRKIKEIIDLHFPEKKYGEIMLHNKKSDGSRYIIFNRGMAPDDLIPLRIVAALICVNYVSYLANSSTQSVTTTINENLLIANKILKSN